MADNKINKNAAELRRDYIRNWRRKNPDKVRLYNQTYWERKAEQKEANDATPKADR